MGAAQKQVRSVAINPEGPLGGSAQLFAAGIGCCLFLQAPLSGFPKRFQLRMKLVNNVAPFSRTFDPR
jgi:hypothetical protein